MNTILTNALSATAYHVQQFGTDDNDSIEVLAGTPTEAVTTLYGANLEELWLNALGDVPEMTHFKATLRVSLAPEDTPRFQQVEFIVTSGEARP